MAGQEVSLSLAHRCMRHASAEFMGLHKCKADTTPQAKLTPEDRVKLFMDNSFARYCAFNHLQNGDIMQVSVPSVWREAVTIIGGDEDEPIFVEGIEVINSPKPSGKTYFVAQSSRWVTADVAKKGMGKKKLKKLGLVGTAVMTKPTLDALAAQLPDVTLVPADEVFRPLRWIKSENELACHRKAFKVAEKAVQAMLDEMKPGMTEFQAIGIAQREIYANGGEYEGHSLYCFGGDRTSNGISRPTGAKLRKNEIIQLNIGARVGGYSSSIGLPVWFGKLPKEQLALVEFGLRAHKYTFELIKAGVEASSIAKKYTQWGCDQGWGDYMLYGPVHGLGIMETESPWIETTSKYKLQENMTYQIDTFFTGNGYGLRWERGCIVTKDGCELMSRKFMSMDCCKLD